MAFSQTASINVLPHKNVHPAVSYTWLLQLLLSSLTNSPPYCEAFISTLFVSFTAATKWHSLLRFDSWWEEGPLGGRNHELNICQTVAYPPPPAMQEPYPPKQWAIRAWPCARMFMYETLCFPFSLSYFPLPLVVTITSNLNQLLNLTIP